MNQDYTSKKKKQYLSEKKNRAKGFTWQKNSCISSERKKKFVQAENSPPSHPHHFSNGLSVNGIKIRRRTISVNNPTVKYSYRKCTKKYVFLWCKALRFLVDLFLFQQEKDFFKSQAIVRSNTGRKNRINASSLREFIACSICKWKYSK